MALFCEILNKHLLRVTVSGYVKAMDGGPPSILTVAKVMAKAALLEQILMSGSTAMIFLTLDTE